MSQEAKDELQVLLARSIEAEKLTPFGIIRRQLVTSLLGHHLTKTEADILKYYIDQATEIDVTN